SGVQKINPKTGKILATYTRSNGLLSNIAYNILEDREKNIWIAQSGGVSKLRYNYKAFRNITASSLPGEKPSLPSPSINTVLPSSFDTDPCLFWAGSSEGGISCFDNDFKSSFIQQQDGLAANWVYGMSYDQDGRLWIGSSKGINSLTFGGKKPINGYTTHHLIRVAGKQADLWYYPSPSILAVNNLQMPADTNSDKHIQSVWFPAYHAIYVLVDNKLIRLDETCGLPTTIFNAASFDDKGYLWVATRDRGIYRTKQPFTSKTLLRIKNKSQPLFEPWWSTEQGAPTNQVDNLLWYQQKMWIGTPSGLFAVDNKTMHVVHKITKAEGLKANNATSFASSPVTHTLWVGTNRGLAEVNPESGKVLKTVTQYDGLVDNEVWFYGSVKVDDSGKVYFGTAKGVSIYDPSQDQANTTPPIIRLTKVLSDQTPGKRNEFSFEYAALSYANEHQIRYQTRLLGFDDEWSSEKTESRTNFTNLPAWFFPKAYTFEVRAVNESGIWSKNKLLYQFSVTPVWWLRWWAFGGYFIVFCGGVFAVDRIQRTRLIKKERENAIIRENQLKTETAIARSEAAEAEAKALQAENELKATELERARELEKAYYELKNTQNRLIQAEKMASLGRLSTGIAHELKNPLNFINNFAELSKDLVDELKDAINNQNWDEINFIMKDLGSNTQKIEEHGKRADSIVNAMMKNSKGSKARFEMANINDILSTYCDLAFNLKNNDKTRLQISLITDFDNTIPQIKLIPSKIGQALQNIIENAFDSVWEQKAKSNGHYIPEVKVSTRKIGENVEINITDNGPGIPKEIAEKIFEPFFTTKPTGQGTGLGLSFSYDIITQIHNGDLKFENSPGSGASFHIILPFS
ncbi:MAG TPA: ATP-binding protein, partial [Balneolaceae bacterium]|nr:ATP-binding protein [Balneolaceae bacterium]